MSSAPQTSIDTPQFGLPGAPADAKSADDNVVRTYLQEEASAHIPFGRLVKLGTPDAGTGCSGAKVPSAKTDKLVGFSTWDRRFSRSTELDDTGILPAVHFGVTEKGVLWIMPEEDVAPGDAVHGRVTIHDSGAPTVKLPGMVGKTDDGVKTINLSLFAQWRTAGGPTSGQPAKLAFDLTNAGLAVTDS